MKKSLLPILLVLSMSLGCKAQPHGTVYEPVRFEEGTPVDAAAEGVEDLFAQDRFLTDTSVTAKGDTVFVVRHANAFVRLEVDGLAGVDKVTLVPMEGEPMDLAAPETGVLTLWMTRAPGRLGAAAVIAETAD